MVTVLGDETTEAPAPEPKLWKSSSDIRLSGPEPKKFPEYVLASTYGEQTEVFKPSKGARPLPNWVKEMLLHPPISIPETPTNSQNLVELLCHVDSMYVRVRRELFKSLDAFRYLKLGTCPVNHENKGHYYLLYPLKKDCGFKKQSNPHFLVITIGLHFKPTSPVLREMPFDITLQCKFPRLFHSYKVGYFPIVKGGTVFIALQPRRHFTLTQQHASGKDITGTKTYTLGEPMYFKASRPDGAAVSRKRLYINKCFMTASQDFNSHPKYTIIDNQGCMIDSKVMPLSKFVPGTSKTVQNFCVGALLFQDKVSNTSTQLLYMHCDISLGPQTPTPSSKACNYDPTTKKWKEVYGSNSVCSCCESTCPSAAESKGSKSIISSPSWEVDVSDAMDMWKSTLQMKSSNTQTSDRVVERFLNDWPT
ncbi:zona pellucida sperm-binding protein 3 [Embiotoca jacksoni]|uniref:zona pellucida sperm-binding protein 3 n=1 Tax=Embiotoca jacksoni TaxID=100190 RepID=UPI003704B61F